MFARDVVSLTPRERRGMVPCEVAVVLAIGLAPLPVPAVVPLVIAASISLWARGRSFGDVTKGPALYALIGALAGAAALALAVLIATPLVESLTAGAGQWSMYPVVRGSANGLVAVVILVGVSAIAAELVLRGWIVERVLELSRGNAMLAVLVGAFAEAIVVGGSLDARLGAALFGVAMGWMHVAGGRSALAPIAARVTFSVGAVVLETMRIVG
jgi:hypothetical protein